jgi:nicotinamidase-related amidase
VEDARVSETLHHDWHIEEREYARHEERRGRRHAYPRLEARRTALVVIDVVPFFVTENPYVRGIVPAVNRLAAGLRDAGGTVAWVAPGASEPTAASVEFFGARVAELYRTAGGPGSVRDRLWSGLETRDEDVYAEKTAPSAFFAGRSELPSLLSARNIDTVLITGTVTNVCVESSVRDASTLGYRVVLVADACAAGRDRDHNATLHVVYRSFGDVRPTDEVLALIAG